MKAIHPADASALTFLDGLWREFFPNRDLPAVPFFTQWKRNDPDDNWYAFVTATRWLKTQTQEIPNRNLCLYICGILRNVNIDREFLRLIEQEREPGVGHDKTIQ